MRTTRRLFSFGSGVGLALFCGCGSDTPPPPEPIAVEQAPQGLEEAFSAQQPSAAPQGAQDAQIRQLVDDARSALSSRDYGRALFALQALSGESGLTDQQRDFVTRAMLSVHQALEQAAGAGDQKAQQALDLRRATK